MKTRLSKTERWAIAGIILRTIRTHRGIRQETLAEQCPGLTHGNISQIENGLRGIPEKQLQPIATALNCPEHILVSPPTLEGTAAEYIETTLQEAGIPAATG